MEKLRNSFAAKVVSVILIAVLTTVFVFSAVALVFGVAANLYSDSQNKTELNEILSDNLNASLNYIVWHTDIENEIFPSISENLMYEIKDENGKVLYSDVDESQSRFSYSENRYFSTYAYVNPEHEASEYEYDDDLTETTSFQAEFVQETSKRINYTITVHLKNELKEKDVFYYITRIYKFIENNEKMLVASSIISAVLTLALFVFLMCSAGHKNGTDGIYISRFDKFPYDITAIITALLITGISYVALYSMDYMGEVTYYNNSVLPFIPPFYALSVMAVSALLSVFCITTAVRLKTRTLIKSTLIYKILRFIFKQIKRLFSFIGYTLRKIPTVWKAAVIISTVFIVDFILLLILSAGGEGAVLLLLFLNFAVAVTLLLICIMFSEIKTGTEKIAKGNTEEKINEYRMLGDLKVHAQNINSINDGIAQAVEQKMKSERFKTELITNVSHDIKTPLTSIINYVDLLSKENIDNENAEEYIEVLSRQSSKLKKLIDDLLEASKASTGNLAVNFTKIEIGTLLSQTLGEYEDRFAEKQLEPVLNNYSQPLFISADNRHIWRIFDNIFNNIAKYAQPNTRVYIDVSPKNGTVEITFKNISKEKLNISGDELMERFVRGDSSRNTEGSGVGLSIAKSLAELQKGRCDVQIDGDLFKVTLSFPIVN